MYKLSYQATAQSPICSFGDGALGNYQALRREKIKLKERKTIVSKFANEKIRDEALIHLLNAIYSSIDFSTRKNQFGNYDEFSDKLLFATRSVDKKSFLTKISKAFNIQSFSDVNIINIIDKFNDDELFELIRTNISYLILALRAYRKKAYEEKKEQKGLFNLDDTEEFNTDLLLYKDFEEVPYIAGNSIRGYLRRLLMRDYLKQLGIDKIERTKYHQLFSGGSLNASAGTENIEERLKLFSLCPPLHLLGTAQGDKMIQGCLKVSSLRLQCLENQTGDQPYHNFLQVNFYTRQDSEKKETSLQVVEDGSKDTIQMIYYLEEFVKGSVFDSQFVVDTDNELTLSCFARMLELWKVSPIVGGKSSIGNGILSFDSEQKYIYSSDLFLDHLKQNKKEIVQMFQSKKNEILL